MRTLTPHNLALMTMLALIGCKHHRAPTTAATTKPTAPPSGQFTSATDGFSVNYPPDWQQRQSSENVLTVHAPTGSAELSIAVPKLPAHIPGMIPLGPVQSGYIDDLKKTLKNVTRGQTIETRIAGATARRFTASGQGDHGTHKIVAAAIVKNDKLYIMTGEADEKDFAAAQTAFDAAAASWKWTK